ncbi:hypothetical protein SISSUDRAFT_1097494 [Sistotremastrum suecicum HHB10207 ss-3]|uniref:Acetyl-coenzyme A carboxylase carboxyl transferase subunit beta domain-containing protein n=1 Tax=Sistotremastrum suecicum HHB10207 ss-3 TaxID=1314776 RepID=A0A165X9F5_9AGAM|nr:hypothetical protein SISSUDRAFT_1097494 [Sistotremastrum suecicum HHB10207 ss-3]
MPDRPTISQFTPGYTAGMRAMMISRGLPFMIFANWRGFSGGQQDMYDEVLKQGSKPADPSSSDARAYVEVLDPLDLKPTLVGRRLASRSCRQTTTLTPGCAQSQSCPA